MKMKHCVQNSSHQIRIAALVCLLILAYKPPTVRALPTIQLTESIYTTDFTQQFKPTTSTEDEQVIQTTTLPGLIQPCVNKKFPKVAPNQQDEFKRTVEATINAEGSYCENFNNYNSIFFCYACIRHPYAGYLDCYSMCHTQDRDECSWRCDVKPQGYNESYLTIFTEIQQQKSAPSPTTSSPTSTSTTTTTTQKISTTTQTDSPLSQKNVPEHGSTVIVEYRLYTAATVMLTILSIGLVCAVAAAVIFGLRYRALMNDNDKRAKYRLINETAIKTRGTTKMATSRESITSDGSELLGAADFNKTFVEQNNP